MGNKGGNDDVSIGGRKKVGNHPADAALVPGHSLIYRDCHLPSLVAYARREMDTRGFGRQ
jgi:hypothetical protein